MTVGESTLRAVYPDARNPFAFPELLDDEGLEAWTVSEVWLGASPRADHAVDVTDRSSSSSPPWSSHVTQVSHAPDLETFVTGWMRADGPSVSASRRAASPRPSTSSTPPDRSAVVTGTGREPAPSRRDRYPADGGDPPVVDGNVPSGPAGAGSSKGRPGTALPGTPFTDSVEYANVSIANAIRSLFTSSACWLLFANVSQAWW